MRLATCMTTQFARSSARFRENKFQDSDSKIAGNLQKRIDLWSRFVMTNVKGFPAVFGEHSAAHNRIFRVLDQRPKQQVHSRKSKIETATSYVCQMISDFKNVLDYQFVFVRLSPLLKQYKGRDMQHPANNDKPKIDRDVFGFMDFGT